MKKISSENSNFSIKSGKDQKIVLSFVCTTFLFISFLASKKVAHGVSGVAVIGMSTETGTLLKNKTKGTLSFFYNLYLYESFNNSVRYGSKTISKVYPSSYTNSIQAIKNPSKAKDDLFILFQLVNTAILNKSDWIISIKKFPTTSLNGAFFKNQIRIMPIYSEIKKITKSSTSISCLEIIGKEVKKLLLTYVILDSVRIIGQQDFGPEMNNVRPVLDIEAEEEKAFQQFLVDSGIDITTLSPKELKRLKNKWRRWRNWNYGSKSLVLFMKYLWYLFFKKVKSLTKFLSEFIEKNYSYLILFLKVILSISMILLLYHFYLKMLHILRKDNLMLLSQLKNVTKDFEKKLLEILGEKQLLSDNLNKKLLAIVEENKILQRLVENCELNNKQNIQLMTYQLYELTKKYQPFIDQLLNRT
jgi:hypothetical protein